MYAVEFDTSIHRGIVHIPLEHLELYEQQKVRVLVMLDHAPNDNPRTTHVAKPSPNASELDMLLEKIHASLPPEVHTKSDDELRFEALRERLL